MVEENICKINFKEFSKRTTELVKNNLGSFDCHIEMCDQPVKSIVEFYDKMENISFDTKFYEIEHVDEQFMTYSVGYVAEKDYEEGIPNFVFSLKAV